MHRLRHIDHASMHRATFDAARENSEKQQLKRKKRLRNIPVDEPQNRRVTFYVMLGRLRSVQVGLLSLVKTMATIPLPVDSRRTYASRTSASSRRDSTKGGKKKHASSLSDEEAELVIDMGALRNQLERSIDRLRSDFVRTLPVRTAVGSIESLVVSFDGQKYPMNEIGRVVRKNPGMVIVDMSATPTAIPSVLQAVAASGMNLNPQQEGTTIAVPLPQVTREHRENLAKNAVRMLNRTKDDLKETQNKFIKEAKLKKGQVSEDLIFSVQQHVTAITDDRIAEAETMLQKKQEELFR